MVPFQDKLSNVRTTKQGVTCTHLGPLPDTPLTPTVVTITIHKLEIFMFLLCKIWYYLTFTYASTPRCMVLIVSEFIKAILNQM